jgi:hypothetical protein
MKAFKEWFKSLFLKKDKEVKKIPKIEDETLLLKIKIAELENSIIQLGEIIRKTNETIVVLQENVNKTGKISNTSLALAQQHEGIFKKIIDDKLLVFGLTKKTRVVDKSDPEPKSD